MALIFEDKVAEYTTGVSSSAFTLNSITIEGYKPFSVLSSSDTCYYYAIDPETKDWEIGLGTYTAGSLARTTVQTSSNFNNKTNFINTALKIYSIVPSTNITDTFTLLNEPADTSLIGVTELNAYGGKILVENLDLNTDIKYKLIAYITSSYYGIYPVFTFNEIEGLYFTQLALYMNDNVISYLNPPANNTGSTIGTLNYTMFINASIYNQNNIIFLDGYMYTPQWSGNAPVAKRLLMTTPASFGNVTSCAITHSLPRFGTGSFCKIFKTIL